jgi:hypothetical protein
VQALEGLSETKVYSAILDIEVVLVRSEAAVKLAIEVVKAM